MSPRIHTVDPGNWDPVVDTGSLEAGLELEQDQVLRSRLVFWTYLPQRSLLQHRPTSRVQQSSLQTAVKTTLLILWQCCNKNKNHDDKQLMNKTFMS